MYRRWGHWSKKSYLIIRYISYSRSSYGHWNKKSYLIIRYISYSRSSYTLLNNLHTLLNQILPRDYPVCKQRVGTKYPLVALSQISLGNNDVVQGTVPQSYRENLLQCGSYDPHTSLQPSVKVSTPTTLTDKRENELDAVDQGLDKLTVAEDLRLEEIEQMKFNFVSGQEGVSLSEVPVLIWKRQHMVLQSILNRMLWI